MVLVNTEVEPMRNTLEHPVTYDEIIAFLNAHADNLGKEMRIGDIRPLLLREAAEIVFRHSTLVD